MERPQGPFTSQCIDCGRPISDRAVRCRFCASRAREGLPPIPIEEIESAQPAELPPEIVAWLRTHGHRYNAARLGLRFNVPVERIRAVINGAAGG
jgi:hypothetical protein